jgi:beta-lactamase class A
MAYLDNTFDRLERAVGGTLGVFASPLDPSGDTVGYRSDDIFPAASTIKVFVLHALLDQVCRGAASLDEEILLDPREQVSGSGVLKALTAGRSYTLLDLATLMIIVSDNTATNLLIERLGVATVNELCRREGWRATELAGKLQRGGTRPSVTSPRDLGEYFLRLWRGQLLPDQLTRTAKEIYGRQQHADQLGRDIGYDSYSSETGDSPLRIASKSGSIRGVRNDAGVIDTGGAIYVLSVMTKECRDQRFHPDNLGSRTISAVSKALYDHYTGIAAGEGE